MLLQTVLEGLGLGGSADYRLRHRYPQGRGGDGASLQPGSSEQVYNAGTYNTRKNQAKCFDFQSGMRYPVWQTLEAEAGRYLQFGAFILSMPYPKLI